MRNIFKMIMILLLLFSWQLALLPSNARTAQVSWIYSLNNDFDEGTLTGVEHASIEDQLQLSSNQETLPFIWIANSGESTVSKINTNTGRELGRYRTGPGAGTVEYPSRIAVDLKGDVWVGNRNSSTAVKIVLYPFDKNGDGSVTTSADVNDNGVIDPDEVLAWGEDEAVLFSISVENEPQALAVDAHNNVWIGGSAGNIIYYDGQTGIKLKSIKIHPTINLMCYGALVDANGTLWIAHHTYSRLTRIDNPHAGTSVNPLGSHTINSYCATGSVYGINIDADGYIYSSGWSFNTIRKFDPLTNIWLYQNLIPSGNEGRGVAIGLDGDIWVAQAGANQVTRHDALNGSLKATINVGSFPTGVAVDNAGKIWCTNSESNNIMRIDPEINCVDFIQEAHPSPDNYSNMTGMAVRNVTTKTGTWTVVFDSELDATAWGTISWEGYEPPGTSISVRVRSSDDLINWSNWETALNEIELIFTPDGRYLEIESTLLIQSGDSSPVLYDLTVSNKNRSPVLGLIGNKSVAEGQPLQFTISASDPDDDSLTYSASGFPSNASFNPSTKTFSWTPNYTQGSDSGQAYQVTFKVQDNGAPSLSDEETITITVNEVNRAPVLAPIGNKSVAEGQPLQFTISASDPDSDPLTYSATGLPSGVSFNPSTKTFSWTPNYTQGSDSGQAYQITFNVQDNGAPSLYDEETITITVNEV
ncbi:MAG: putative Ig domain-containing protein, partial [Deltaproteobacteria bacterium]|nr:putative Ig domain-containing protein [Deltaproteobacteria bacterium]